ncbi:MAG: hypothetical protein DDT22_00843 [candidate division WS2 bacterium]|nr:hypothetical protein [Candidatus Lithacetigena glycinireducens]
MKIRKKQTIPPRIKGAHVSPVAVYLAKKVCLCDKKILITDFLKEKKPTIETPYAVFVLNKRKHDTPAYTAFNSLKSAFIYADFPFSESNLRFIILLNMVTKGNAFVVIKDTMRLKGKEEIFLQNMGHLNIPVILLSDGAIFRKITQKWFKEKSVKTELYPHKSIIQSYMQNLMAHKGELPIGLNSEFTQDLFFMLNTKEEERLKILQYLIGETRKHLPEQRMRELFYYGKD